VASALAADKVTVKVAFALPALPSVTEALPMLSAGAGSSFTIIPVPWLTAIVALVAPLRTTLNVSSPS
jgi:hypothetical protein